MNAYGLLLRGKKKMTKAEKRKTLIGWCFVLPAVVLFFCFIFLPIVISIVTSFSDFNGPGVFTTTWKFSPAISRGSKNRY